MFCKRKRPGCTRNTNTHGNYGQLDIHIFALQFNVRTIWKEHWNFIAKSKKIEQNKRTLFMCCNFQLRWNWGGKVAYYVFSFVSHFYVVFCFFSSSIQTMFDVQRLVRLRFIFSHIIFTNIISIHKLLHCCCSFHPFSPAIRMNKYAQHTVLLFLILWNFIELSRTLSHSKRCIFLFLMLDSRLSPVLVNEECATTKKKPYTESYLCRFTS